MKHASITYHIYIYPDKVPTVGLVETKVGLVGPWLGPINLTAAPYHGIYL